MASRGRAIARQAPRCDGFRCRECVTVGPDTELPVCPMSAPASAGVRRHHAQGLPERGLVSALRRSRPEGPLDRSAASRVDVLPQASVELHRCAFADDRSGPGPDAFDDVVESGGMGYAPAAWELLGWSVTGPRTVPARWREAYRPRDRRALCHFPAGTNWAAAAIAGEPTKPH
jgi:hypothetical protein